MKGIDQSLLVQEITEQIIHELKTRGFITPKPIKEYVKVSISARHVHLQRDHVEILFGKGHRLKKLRDISQPGQFACYEQVTIQGPKGKIEKVRVIGPTRSQTQVEVSRSDARKLGINPPVRNSGDLEGSAPITLIGPHGTVHLSEGCIIADRHIHMTPKDAEEYRVKNNQKVSVLVEGPRGGILGEVTIRVSEKYALDMHIDTDDANAFGLTGTEWLKIIT